jgi:hypothetical protein
VSSFLPDGKHKIEFFSDGVLEVTALEREDGGKKLPTHLSHTSQRKG